MPLAHRYALYLAPSGPWQEQGSRWLGRCAETGAALERQPGMPAAAQEWTRAPRHYGLHATLKPLPPDRRRRAVECGPGRRRAGGSAQRLRHRTGMRALRGFLAWRLTGATRRAAHAFTRWPTPPCANWIRCAPAHARGTGQTPAPSAGAGPARAAGALGLPLCVRPVHLPHHPERKLADAELRQAQACIARYADPLAGRPMPVDGVSVYVQPGPGDFLAARHYRFDGGREDVAGAAYMRERRRHERRAPDLPDGRVRQRQDTLLRCARSCVPTNPSSSRIATSRATAAPARRAAALGR